MLLHHFLLKSTSLVSPQNLDEMCSAEKGQQETDPLSLLCSFSTTVRHMMDYVASNCTVLHNTWEN